MTQKRGFWWSKMAAAGRSFLSSGTWLRPRIGPAIAEAARERSCRLRSPGAVCPAGFGGFWWLSGAGRGGSRFSGGLMCGNGFANRSHSTKGAYGVGLGEHLRAVNWRLEGVLSRKISRRSGGWFGGWRADCRPSGIQEGLRLERWRANMGVLEGLRVQMARTWKGGAL